MAKEVKLRMTLDGKGAVKSTEQVGGGFKRMGGHGKSAGKAGHAGFLKIAAGAAVALGAIRVVQGGYRALKGFIKSSISETAQLQDETAKLSHKIGVSTETLSAYRLATELSGTTIDVLAVALRTVSKNSYDFTQGTGLARIAFEELGIEVTDSNGKLKTSEEILLEVSDKLMLLESTTKRTAMAQLIFGRSGTELLPMMEKGRAGIEALKDEAHALGLTFTDETATASEEYNDSISRLNGALTGMKMKIGQEVIPVLTDLATWVVENESLMQDLAATAKGIGTGIVTSIQGIARALEYYYGTMRPFWTEWEARQKGIKGKLTFGLLGSAKAVEEEIAAQRRKGEVFGNIAWQMEQAQLKASLGIRETIEGNRKLGDSFDDLPLPVNNAISVVEQWNNALLASAHHAEETVRAYGDTEAGLEDLYARLNAIRAEKERLQQELEAFYSSMGGGDVAGRISGPRPEIGAGITPEAIMAEETVSALNLMTQAAQTFGQAGAQAFGQWARGAAGMGTSLKRAGAQALASLATVWASMAISELGMAFASMSPWGVALYGLPGPHFAAAKLFGSLALGAGLAARATSGGEGGMGAPGTAFNPVYIQPASPSPAQQIYSGQSEVFVEIRDTLARIKTVPAGQVVLDGVKESGGVAAIMDDNDKNTLSGEVLQSRYAR